MGPNNSGKSATLRAIREKIASPMTSSPVVASVHTQRVGSSDDLVAWLDSTSNKGFDSSLSIIYHAFGTNLYQVHARNAWDNPANGIQLLTRFFCHHLTADARLRAADAPSSINMTSDAPTHPIHVLYREDQLEPGLSQQFRRAFNVDLIVHRAAGAKIPLHVGARPRSGPDRDRVSKDFVRDVEALPTLESQGDGMRSFAGTLLETSVGRESILLVDEPEAFLHPPQARLLGKMLVANKPLHRQLIVATHSGDVLRGIIDAGDSNVRVIRLQRSNDVNIARQLDNGRISELWRDTLLRYSNILDGLFHERVVVCESDADCRFYGALTEAVAVSGGDERHWPDTMFTHCGGKDRMPVAIRALRELDVPVSAVTDFDALNAEQPLRGIVVAKGGDWSVFEADWKLVKTTIDGKKPELSTREVANEIEAILKSVEEAIFPTECARQIQNILRRSSPWATAKSAGKHYVPSGEPTKACDRLLAGLRALGVFVVPEGELEGFVRSVGGHGPTWVNAALEKDLKSDPELDGARAFASAIAFP